VIVAADIDELDAGRIRTGARPITVARTAVRVRAREVEVMRQIPSTGECVEATRFGSRLNTGCRVDHKGSGGRPALSGEMPA
jgi:hypothetical protein